MIRRDISKACSESAVVEARGLSKRFKDVQAVNSLDLRVRSGEIYGFLGPNGAGKTTTIKMIMGLAHPSAGDVLVNGQIVSGNSVEVRREIGYLPERISFFDNLTPLQTLGFFCELKGVNKSIIESLLREVGLQDESHRKVGTFSKGMVQLLGFAQAMIGNPSIYILDEPMIGLDARWVRIVREKIKDLNEKGATIFFSSHILTEVQNLCDRVAIINKGRLVAEDTVTDLSKHLRIKPRLEVRIAGLNGEVPDFVLSVEGVEGASAEGDKLSVTCDVAVRLHVITALKEGGISIQGFKTIEPSLEEAFVKLISKDEGGFNDEN